MFFSMLPWIRWTCLMTREWLTRTDHHRSQQHAQTCIFDFTLLLQSSDCWHHHCELWLLEGCSYFEVPQVDWQLGGVGLVPPVERWSSCSHAFKADQIISGHIRIVFPCLARCIVDRCYFLPWPSRVRMSLRVCFVLRRPLISFLNRWISFNIMGSFDIGLSWLILPKVGHFFQRKFAVNRVMRLDLAVKKCRLSCFQHLYKIVRHSLRESTVCEVLRKEGHFRTCLLMYCAYYAITFFSP